MNFGCTMCQGSGWAAVQDRKTHSMYGFRCHCSLGDNYSAKIAKWSNDLKKNYYCFGEVLPDDFKLKAANDKPEQPIEAKTQEFIDSDDVPF